MPIQRISSKQYIMTINKSIPQVHEGKLGMHARNPLYKKWRKVSSSNKCGCNNTILNEEVIKTTCCRKPIRGGALKSNQEISNPTYRRNYNFRQYLQNKCKTIHQNSFNFSTDNTELPPNTFRANCCGGNCKCPTVTYKPNNKQFSQQGAVSSSARLLRLKYNTLTCGSCANGARHRPAKIIKPKTCQERVLGAGKRIFRSGGCPKQKRRNPCTDCCPT